MSNAPDLVLATEQVDPGDPADEGRGDELHAYFHAIERVFIALRGAPLLLAPADWQIARRWHHDGVPLSLVLDTLAAVFAKRRERQAAGALSGRIVTLRYCAPAVDAAWLEQRALLAPGLRADEAGEGAAASGSPLQATAFASAQSSAAGAAGREWSAALRGLAELLPDDLPGRASWVATICGIEANDLVRINDQLRAIDDALVEVAASHLDDAARGAVAGELRRLVGGLRQRLPDAEVARVRYQLERQLLRERCGLPRLSLDGD